MTTTHRRQEFVSDEDPVPGAFEVADIHAVYGDCWVAYTKRIAEKLKLIQVGRALGLAGLGKTLEHHAHHADHAPSRSDPLWESEFDESDGCPGLGLPDLCGEYGLPPLGSR